MKDLKPFQLIFIGVCLFLGVAGMLIFSFAGTKPNSNQDTGPQVVIWGTLPDKAINDAIAAQNTNNLVTLNATYVQKDPSTFSQDLLEALADSKGPDVILVPIDDLMSYRSKITTIPFTSFTQRTFQDSFIQEGQLLQGSSGYYGLPFVVDPLMLYWNRDIFTAHNISTPPTTWEDIASLVPTLSQVSTDLTISKSAISLGDYRNIDNAKEIFSSLLLQSGIKITTLNSSQANQVDPLSAALDENTSNVLNFYTQFADPSSKTYTWNRSLPDSLSMFTANNLAMYIGFGSEAQNIQTMNPNLNFDMALLPQFKSQALPSTYGRIYVFSILNASANKTGAINAIASMTGNNFVGSYIKNTNLAPARRDLLATPGTDAYSPLIYKSALYANAWLDPDPATTNSIFQTMVESLLAGRDNTSSIVGQADNRLIQLITTFNQKFGTI
jgi:ABC-type glycerol-3-phosphate transport system substrate-binding protein